MKLIGIIIFVAFTALVSFGQGAENKKFKDESEVPRIVIEDAKKAFDDRTAIFIDARAADIYKQEHIKGAISIPYNPSGTDFDKLPKGKRIIVYCS